MMIEFHALWKQLGYARVPWYETSRADSSNINEVIRAVLFFYKKISHARKRTKRTKSKNANKQLSLRCFLMHIKRIKSIKSTKSTKCQASDFLPLRWFYVHKNAVFFVSHTKKHKKHKKHAKSIKTQISKQATFFPLDVF